MSDRETPWLPRVGDRVTVREMGAIGEVVMIVGEGDTRRFLVDLPPEAVEQTLHELGLPEATAPERHSYRLEEIGPPPSPGSPT